MEGGEWKVEVEVGCPPWTEGENGRWRVESRSGGWMSALAKCIIKSGICKMENGSR